MRGHTAGAVSAVFPLHQDQTGPGLSAGHTGV